MTLKATSKNASEPSVASMQSVRANKFSDASDASSVLRTFSRARAHTRVRARAESETCVRSVRKEPPTPLLSDQERVLLRWCGRDSDPFILEAIRLFDATIVGVDANHDRA
jgi:hypothetical protein